MILAVPELRLRPLTGAEPRGDGAYVLYWMIAQRRLRANHALQYATREAERLGKPLLVFEPLDVSYRWASDRHHAFVVQGMGDHARTLALRHPEVGYLPWVERAPGDGEGLLHHLARQAALVVTDDHPGFRYPGLLQRAAASVKAPLIAVDGVGVFPLRATPKAFSRAVDFRRWIHKNILDFLGDLPMDEPLRAARLPSFHTLPEGLAGGWAPTPIEWLGSPDLSSLPIDHEVAPTALEGGSTAAEARLTRFLDRRIDRYTERNHPDAEAASGLSPYLHYGHIGGAQVFRAAVDASGWTPDTIDRDRLAKQEGFWGAEPGVESFFEELLTWRELGHVAAHHDPDFERYEGLPAWARTTLAEHRDDPREAIYDLDTLTHSGTDDPLWNAAQRQLVEQGVVHNYLRMLWGKRVLAWTRTPEEAWDVLVELNNRWALDGRDPNSYSGIAWVFGRFDRAWGPERPIYGKVRYMTSKSTLRKLKLNDYLARWDRDGALRP